MADSEQSDVVVTSEKPSSSDNTLVDWDGPNDPQSPFNFSFRRKWLITISLSFLNATTTFSSSIFSTATKQTAEYFHVGEEVMVLGTSLYLLGFVFGPVLFG
jgi:MFS transporter, DHA1 family, multidrug resistance protein